jgi:D-alanyl-D-alanine carboxypeptidase/D-alanyl-D-alanine-endopeptidase (penicillin-binding protein 4)
MAPGRARRPRRVACCLALGFCLAAAAGGAADRDRLLFHAETFEGAELASSGADTLFNPASLIKVGTSLWALERLGADHRYRTVFGVAGAWDRAAGSLEGPLVVQGWGDPDFQAENAFLVARRLNRMQLRSVAGGLRIDGELWVGWENGAGRRVTDVQARADLMGRRLRMVLDPRRWDTTTRAAWEAVCARRGWDPRDPPRVEIKGPVAAGAPQGWQPVLLHLSNPLPVLLRRFNVYSNNDIIRVADTLGGVPGLEAFLEHRLGVPPEAIELETASGERRNRISARTGVRLLRAFFETLGALGLTPGDVLPVIGCDPGATNRKFPKLATVDRAGGVAVKTGTLVQTDGGVAVVGGTFTSPDLGRVLFCVAAPETGWNEAHWRGLQQSWLLELLERTGGAIQQACGPELPFSDTQAEVEWVVPW